MINLDDGKFKEVKMKEIELKEWTTAELKMKLADYRRQIGFGYFSSHELMMETWIANELDRRDTQVMNPEDIPF